MATAPRQERLPAGLGVAVSLAAVTAIVIWATAQPAPHLPSSSGHLGELAAALGVYAVATLVRAWRWHVILRLDGIPHTRSDALGLLVVTYMGNTVLPARGGELLRVFILSARSGARKAAVLGSIIAERVLDAVVLASLFVVLTLAGVGGAPAGVVPAILAAVGVLGLVLGGITYLWLRRRGRLKGFADRVRPVTSASRPLWRPVGLALVAATTLVWVLEGCLFALVAASLQLDVGPLEGLFLNVLASFFALIPAAPGYVGTLDAAMLFGLHAIGVNGGAAVSFTLLVRFVLFVPITVAGGILLVTRYGGLGQIRRMRNQPRPAAAG